MDIAANYPLFEQFTTFTVNCGNNIRFWEDIWCDNQPLQALFPDLYMISRKKNVPIVECWNGEQQSWSLDFKRGLFDREVSSWMALVEKINFVNLGDGQDNIRWTLDASGMYTAKSMFQNMTKAQLKYPPLFVTRSGSINVRKKSKCFCGPL
ncbi:MAG: hypothetical protein Q8754_02990, partial [Sweet potato little leaf phytoplasma]|nr:hypothetical protein [Sweet potato little leaf phytoplasma]